MVTTNLIGTEHLKSARNSSVTTLFMYRQISSTLTDIWQIFFSLWTYWSASLSNIEGCDLCVKASEDDRLKRWVIAPCNRVYFEILVLQTSDGRLAMHVFPQHSLTEMSYFKKTHKVLCIYRNRKTVFLKDGSIEHYKTLHRNNRVNMNFKTLIFTDCIHVQCIGSQGRESWLALLLCIMRASSLLGYSWTIRLVAMETLSKTMETFTIFEK